MSEEEVVNKFLNMIATEYDGNLARQFQNQYNLKYKEIEQLQQKIDKAIEYIENKQNEIEKQPDYSKYVCPSIVEAMEVNNLSRSGMILETIKSTTIKNNNELLDILKGGNNESN